MPAFFQDPVSLFMLGKYLIASTFALSALQSALNWDKAITFLKTKDITAEGLTLSAAHLWQTIGVGLLFYPPYERTGAVLLILYTLLASIRFYPFWKMANVEQYINAVFFLTNVGVIGGLVLLIAASTSGSAVLHL